jgi:hypothetical protein
MGALTLGGRAPCFLFPPVQAQIERLEARLAAFPQVEMETVHHYSDGLFARELHIPAGTILTGAVHRFRNLNTLLAGEMSVLTEAGIVRVRAPFVVVSPPGTKRIAYAHTDCIWMTVHATSETDPDVVREQFTSSSYAEFKQLQSQGALTWSGL